MESDETGTPGRRVLAALDARPILARGEHPLDEVLAALAALSPDGALRLTAPFEPRPLVELLRERGHRVELERAPDGAHELLVLGLGAPALLDLRALPAPEPLEAVLRAVERLAGGAALVARVPRVPTLLLPRLGARGLRHALLEERDGSALLHVRRPADPASP